MIGPDVAEAWLEQAKSAGILEVLITDPLPGTDRSAPVVAAAKAMGLHAILVLPLPEVQVEDAALIALASGFANAAPDRVQLRDEAGVLTDERLARLIAPLRAGLGCIPLDLHTRCQTSYGPLVALEAARLGLDGLDLALAPVANGGSVPALGRFLKSLATLGIGDHVAADFTSVTDASNRLAELADFHDWEIGRPWAFGLAPYRHNLPGDVAAQAMAALTKAGLSRRINDLAEECAAIRRCWRRLPGPLLHKRFDTCTRRGMPPSREASVLPCNRWRAKCRVRLIPAFWHGSEQSAALSRAR